MRCTWHSTVFQSKENGFTICRYATDQSACLHIHLIQQCLRT